MLFKISVASLLMFAVVRAADLPAQPVGGQASSITIWVMPNEPAGDDIGRPVEELRDEITEVSEKYGRDHNVTLLNVTVPFLREQLLAMNRPYAMQLWPLVNGQKRVLEELDKFVESQRVHVNVRILDWTGAFAEIREILDHPERAQQPLPDIIQIGTTWRSYFAANKLLQPPTSSQMGNLAWKTPRQQDTAGTLPLILDVRLLYYWKRMPRRNDADHELTIDATNWDTILKSLDDHMRKQSRETRLPPVVVPILADTVNVLHDYVPLVWAGGGDFLRPDDTAVDLTSEPALKVPLLIKSYSMRQDAKQQPYWLFAYPEVSPYEANGLVIRGLYSGCFAPLAFLPRFYGEFCKMYPKADFSKCVGVAAPPSTFVGGSDLMVTKRDRTPNLEIATFAAARFLASGGYAEHLAELGQTPVHIEDLGIAQSLKPLKQLSPEYKERVTNVILDAARTSGREYAPCARFPTVIESRETGEKLQVVWRRMSEAYTDEQFRQAARDAQQNVNSRLDFQVSPPATVPPVAPPVDATRLLTGTALGILFSAVAIILGCVFHVWSISLGWRTGSNGRSGLPNPPRSARPGATNSVFVVHGHDQGLTTAVARYLEKLKLKANILHERGNPGATIIEKFEAASDVDFAVVLATGDDLFTSPTATNAGAPATPQKRARQNVIFELGFFFAKLSRARTALVTEPEVELPSDCAGIIYIDRNEWQKRLLANLGEAGFKFDQDDVIEAMKVK